MTHSRTVIVLRRFSKTRAYFLVSELTTPAKYAKIWGTILATNIDPHRDSHTDKNQVKNQTSLTPPIFGSEEETCVAPTMTGTIRIRATGKMYIEYRVPVPYFKIFSYNRPIWFRWTLASPCFFLLPPGFVKEPRASFGEVPF